MAKLFNNLIDMIEYNSKAKRVLSLFDGLGGARLALDKADIPVSEYYSSEIDTYAMAVSKYNYPKIKPVGDVTRLKASDYSNIDLLIGGSPCFVAGTRIICEGYKYKNIEDIQVGDSVYTHKGNFQKVLNTGGDNKTIYKIEANGIEDTYTTGNHPYYVKETFVDYDGFVCFDKPKWKEVDEINSRWDWIGVPVIEEMGLSMDKFSDIESFWIENIIWIPIKNIQKMDYKKQVYNLEVENDNSYTANNAIVHNCQSFSFAGKRNGMSTKDKIEVTTLEQYLELKEQKFEFEGQSYLFWEYVRMLKEVKPKYFLLENVMMAQRWRDIITNTLFEIQYGKNWERINLGNKKERAKFKNNLTEEIIEWDSLIINSSLLSAQNRKRQYWTNIKGITIPEDEGLVIKDILDKESDKKHILLEKMLNGLYEHKRKQSEKGNGYGFSPKNLDEKASTITNPGKIRPDDTYIKIGALRGRYLEDGKRKDKVGVSVAGKTTQRLEVRIDDKSNCLTTVQKDNLVVTKNKGCIQVGVATDINGHESIKRIYSQDGKSPTVNTCTGGNREPKVAIIQKGRGFNKGGKHTEKSPTVTSCAWQENNILEEDYTIDEPVVTYRKLTPLECERLQTIPDNFSLVPFKQGKKTKMMSNSQRYKMIGNGFTISVIAHILSFMKKGE